MSFFQSYEQDVDVDDPILAYQDEQPDDFADDIEFAGFDEFSPRQDELQVGFHHQQQLGRLPVYDRQGLFLIELYRELENYFSSNTADFYKESVEKYIPRFWTKNAFLLAYSINIYHFNQQLTKQSLLSKSKSIQTQPANLLRYYYLVLNTFSNNKEIII
jgi:hypothetical protein